MKDKLSIKQKLDHKVNQMLENIKINKREVVVITFKNLIMRF